MTREEKDRSYLVANDVFWRFLEDVARARESHISSLADADDGKVREISGKITALTDILNQYDWPEVQKKLSRL